MGPNERESMWDKFGNDGIDYELEENWEEVHESLTHYNSWDELGKGGMFCEMGLEMYNAEDRDTAIMCIPYTFDYAYSGNTKELKIKEKEPFWDAIVADASEALGGVELKSHWWISGVHPGA